MKIYVNVQLSKKIRIKVYVFGYEVVALEIGNSSHKKPMSPFVVDFIRHSGIVKSITIKEVSVASELGKENNPFLTALAVAGISSLTGNTLKFAWFNRGCTCDVKVVPTYSEDVLNMRLVCIIELSIIDVVLSMIRLCAFYFFGR